MDLAERRSGESGSTSGGGGGGGVPRMFSNNHAPRVTGEVSTPLAVAVMTLG